MEHKVIIIKLALNHNDKEQAEKYAQTISQNILFDDCNPEANQIEDVDWEVEDGREDTGDTN